MAKPLNENLKAVCIETEEGDLIPVMDLAGAKFSENSKKASAPKKPALISDYRKLRRQLDLNQSEFWSRIGVTQSGGSRYESGRPVPKPTAILARLIYIKGMDIDARDFK